MTTLWVILAQAPLVVAVALQSMDARSSRYSPMESADVQIGVTNKFGVTRYHANTIRRANSTGGFYWPDPSSRESAEYAGATDLTDNISWGWHHPNGPYNTIPVGAPLIDKEMNIYLASDDAIRKFSPEGDLIWSYGPRGQIAAAPALSTGASARRNTAGVEDFSSQEEADLRPHGSKEAASFAQVSGQEFKVGDRVRVLPGKGYHKQGKEYYKAGDEGEIREIKTDQSGRMKAILQWPRTGFENTVQLASMGNRFERVRQSVATPPDVLLGSTTSGWVFAVNLKTGEEVWATQASEQISGVKGSIGVKDGIVVVATDRCVDKYCYRYRNQTLLTPSNSVVRGLDLVDGSSVWSFKPFMPVWNFVPQFSDDAVMFQDFSGYAYSLDFKTGALKWRADGVLGPHTQGAAVYDKWNKILFAMGVQEYDNKYCNPYPSPGILPWCATWPGQKGWLRAYDARNGRLMWEKETDEPPASGSMGMVKAYRNEKHLRLIFTTGFNCHYNSPTTISAIDPKTGQVRWTRDGPTLWTSECAGDFEGGDVRRVMGGRSICDPGSWSTPVVDSEGDVYVGNQVGELQRWSTINGGSRSWYLASTLNTGVAFQDQSISFAPGMMAVSTCNSLIVFQTENTGWNDNVTWSNYTLIDDAY